METGVTRVTRLHSAHDLGRLVNPASAEGQVEGGVLQGLGFALLEEVQVQGGRVVNGRLSEYLVPTVADVPEVRVVFVEHALPSGPHGAKGLGGATVAAVAPAIIAAIRHAAGIRLDRLPATPERVFAALCQKASEDTGRRVRRG
jgi:CO/xanthine dehydrogenase Mo-binding subunit